METKGDVMWTLIKITDFENLDAILLELQVKDRTFILNGVSINEEE